jgi:hypothetical protein
MSLYRFSEQDLLMRYHWGLGVGHLHAHQSQPAATAGRVPEDDTWDVGSPEYEAEETLGGNDADNHVYDFGDAEFGLEDPELEGWEDVESEEEGGEDEDVDSEEEDLTGMY